MKFIHISDLHFHRHVSDNEAATSMLQFINQNYPDHKLIVTGDIVDDGDEEQFDRAYEALEPFKRRIFICPGNHDFGAAGNFYSKERAERFDRKLSIRLQQGGTFTADDTPLVNLLIEQNDNKVMLIALDTNLETDHPFDYACGQVGERQLSFLKTVLTDPTLGDRTKILFFHHHPFIHNDPFMELMDARELMRTIYNLVDVVCFGHKHVSDSWENINGIKYVLAADNSPVKDWAREINIFSKIDIAVTDIKIRTVA